MYHRQARSAKAMSATIGLTAILRLGFSKPGTPDALLSTEGGAHSMKGNSACIEWRERRPRYVLVLLAIWLSEC